MSEEEDLELLALQRQLDDAFQTTRPRPDFEHELWSRMQSRRPIWPRVAKGLAGIIESFRGSRLPSMAAGLALIVLMAAGIFTLAKGPHGGGASTAAGSASNASGLAPQTADFGLLPRPAAAQPSAALPGSSPYAGAATLVWAGTLQVTATALPVYRYDEPTRAVADALSANLGATPSTDVAQGGIGVYAGRNFTVVVLSSVAQPAREPYFNVSDLKTAVPTTGDSVTLATAYLAAHHLLPTWPYQTDVQTLAGTTVRVDFLRSFDVPGLGRASLVDSAGNPYGTEVDFVPGVPGDFERVPLPLPLVPATYPIISANQAIIALGAESAPSGGSIPVIRITQAQLVYTLVWGGDHSYYEPAYLFSGTFSNHGVASVKRVLIPAVVPALLAP
ncbi:MAG TPA: hypothetical protein VNU19_16325 [Candidatus Acidoferrum sp.]|jgi:hypothetical protein|nr:hypothetical protein [Candidatus Acidoferrum sp.]